MKQFSEEATKQRSFRNNRNKIKYMELYFVIYFNMLLQNKKKSKYKRMLVKHRKEKINMKQSPIFLNSREKSQQKLNNTWQFPFSF